MKSLSKQQIICLAVLLQPIMNPNKLNPAPPSSSLSIDSLKKSLNAIRIFLASVVNGSLVCQVKTDTNGNPISVACNLKVNTDGNIVSVPVISSSSSTPTPSQIQQQQSSSSSSSSSSIVQTIMSDDRYKLLLLAAAIVGGYMLIKK
jgi:hypothetical protein